MRAHYLTLGLTLLLLTGIVSVATAKDQHGTGNQAETKELSWKASSSGSTTNTQSDTNHDSNKGSLLNGGFTSTFGPGTVQSVGEFAPSGPGTCPNGNPGFIVTLLPGTGHSVSRFDRTGDLLFTEYSATLCVDSVTSIQFYSWEDTITGGTGRFTGATGSNSGSGEARLLFSDAEGNFLAEFTSSLEGTINVIK